MALWLPCCHFFLTVLHGHPWAGLSLHSFIVLYLKPLYVQTISLISKSRSEKAGSKLKKFRRCFVMKAFGHPVLLGYYAQSTILNRTFTIAKRIYLVFRLLAHCYIICWMALVSVLVKIQQYLFLRNLCKSQKSQLKNEPTSCFSFQV